jgi:class 3 adenylate cyclase
MLRPVVALGEDQIRPVTFLFADIVGSTSLGERLSADEVKALVGE